MVKWKVYSFVNTDQVNASKAMATKETALNKITRPNVSAVFPRERLFKLLDKSRNLPLTWISSPAGSGKTTLVASYLKVRNLPCLWYRMDERDSDAATLFYYLGLAAKKAAPRKRKPLPLLAPEYMSGIFAFTRHFFEQLFIKLGSPFIIVLDDYQQVPTDSKIHEVLREGLSMMPQGINAFVISRKGLPPEMIGLQANRHLSIIGWDDIRFSLDESEGVVNLHGEGRFTGEMVKQLHHFIQGWIAGIILLLLKARTQETALQLEKEYAKEDIFAYFAGEIIRNLDNKTQRFLMKTAFMPKITPRIARDLTDVSGAGRILLSLMRDNFLIEARYHPAPEYEYHPLFRDFLLSRVEKEFARHDILRIQRRAAKLCEESGQIRDAVEIYYRAREWEALPRLINKEATTLLAQGRHQTLETWLDYLPLEVFESDPWLLFWKGICRQLLNPAGAVAYLEKAYDGFKAKPDVAGLFLAWTGIVDCHIHARANYIPLDRWIEAFESLRKEYPEFPSGEVEARVTVSIFSALFMRQPMHPDLPQWEERAKELIRGPMYMPQKMMIGTFLVRYYCWTGDFTKARWVTTTLKPAVEKAGTNIPLGLIMLKGMEALLSWLNADFVSARELANDALDLSASSGIHMWDPVLWTYASYVALSLGDTASAGKSIEKVGAILDEVCTHEVAAYLHIVAWKAMLEDDFPLAVEHIGTALKLSLEIGSPFTFAMAHAVRAQILTLSGKKEDALKELEKATELAHSYGYSPIIFRCLLIRSQLVLDQGSEALGLKYLAAAMKLGSEKKIWNMDFWVPKTMSRLCLKALESEIEVNYVKKLIRKQNLFPDQPPFDCRHWPWLVEISTLGRFSLVVNGNRIAFSGKAQKKPLEMLKALIAYGGRGVPKKHMEDQIWPATEGDKAHQAFATTLHRLRKLVGNEEVVELREGILSLNLRHCWVDTWVFERKIVQADANFEKGDDDGAIRLLEEAVALYQGSFLAEDSDAPWAVSYCERVRSEFIRQIVRLGRYWETAGELDKAVSCYHKGLEVEALAEAFYQQLMLCLKRSGRKTEGVAVYHRCKSTFSSRLGLGPSSETETIYKSLLSN